MSELPLTGQWIVITRAAGQSRELRDRLESLGARVSELATIEIQPAEDYGPLEAALARIGAYDWLVFTSSNGVRYFANRARAAGIDFEALPQRICAIGPATADAVERLGRAVDLLPDRFVAESVVDAFEGEDVAGKRILLPRAAVARDVLPEQLRARGAEVDVVPVYRTVIPAGAAGQARALFGGPSKPDWITFTSSSTVANFVEAAGAACLSGVGVATIGPITSATARDLGLTVDVEASEFTAPGLVDALAAACTR